VLFWRFRGCGDERILEMSWFRGGRGDDGVAARCCFAVDGGAGERREFLRNAGLDAAFRGAGECILRKKTD